MSNSELVYEIETDVAGVEPDELDRKFNDLTRKLDRVSTENEILKIRIQQFERMTLRLAERADELQRSLEQLQTVPDV
jgi:chromosome segregation ATPase